MNKIKEDKAINIIDYMIYINSKPIYLYKFYIKDNKNYLMYIDDENNYHTRLIKKDKTGIRYVNNVYGKKIFLEVIYKNLLDN